MRFPRTPRREDTPIGRRLMCSYSRDLLRFLSSSARDGKHCSSPILCHDSWWDKFLATQGACWHHHQGRGEISIGVSLIIHATRCATRGHHGPSHCHACIPFPCPTCAL